MAIFSSRLLSSRPRLYLFTAFGCTSYSSIMIPRKTPRFFFCQNGHELNSSHALNWEDVRERFEWERERIIFRVNLIPGVSCYLTSFSFDLCSERKCKWMQRTNSRLIHCSLKTLKSISYITHTAHTHSHAPHEHTHTYTRLRNPAAVWLSNYWIILHYRTIETFELLPLFSPFLYKKRKFICIN